MSPLYTFFRYCEKCKLEKEILDCGAGGKAPPLYIFYLFGYKTHGVDISEKQIKEARVFCEEKGIDLDLRKGDMRNLSFKNGSISFVYSYDTIFHMPKKEIAITMDEMKRVLKKHGLLFVNFVSTENSGFGKGREVGNGEFMQNGHFGEILLAYYKENEPDQYFTGLDLLCKQRRVMKFTGDGARALGFNVDREEHVYASLDYFARKK